MLDCKCQEYGGEGQENFGDVGNLAFKNGEEENWKESQLIRISKCDNHKLVVRLGEMHVPL